MRKLELHKDESLFAKLFALSKTRSLAKDCLFSFLILAGSSIGLYFDQLSIHMDDADGLCLAFFLLWCVATPFYLLAMEFGMQE